MKKIRGLMLVVAVALLAGCASPMKMAVNKETQSLDLSSEALLLLSADITNNHKPGYQPEPTILYVEEPNGGKAYNFLMDKDGRLAVESDAGAVYFFRANLKPGKYIVRGIGGFSGLFPVRGNFFLPLHSEIEVTDSDAFYLGRVVGSIRERQENEFRAGLVIPLLDQAVTGFSSGTFEISIIDNSQQDLQLMGDLYPALQGTNVKVALLPPFDRDYAQKWWEDH